MQQVFEKFLHIVHKNTKHRSKQGKVRVGKPFTICQPAFVPRKIRQLIADLKQAGFVQVPGGKGSHRKFQHLKLSGSLILSGQHGADAQHYQEKQVRNAIREANR